MKKHTLKIHRYYTFNDINEPHDKWYVYLNDVNIGRIISGISDDLSFANFIAKDLSFTEYDRRDDKASFDAKFLSEVTGKLVSRITPDIGTEISIEYTSEI